MVSYIYVMLMKAIRLKKKNEFIRIRNIYQNI